MNKKGHDHLENHHGFPGLKVNEGIDSPPVVHPESVKKFLQKKRTLMSSGEFFSGIREGNISVLSKAVTLIESSRADHKELARDIILKCLPFSGNSVRIGITGVPGVGKSMFIEAIGAEILEKGGKLAVLAIDPSSQRSRGSILGDKTRMEKLSASPGAYIRPSPSAGSLGGVARKTRETIILCEAAGFSTIFVETMGVGQSETSVHSMTDLFVLLLLPGAGDELQGIKRGIMEMADILVVNKTDGSNIQKAELAKSQLSGVLHLFPPKESGWIPGVFTCSSLSGNGIREVLKAISDYFSVTGGNGFLLRNRQNQSVYWLNETIDEQLKGKFYDHPWVKNMLPGIRQKVVNAEISPFEAAHYLIDNYFHEK